MKKKILTFILLAMLVFSFSLSSFATGNDNIAPLRIVEATCQVKCNSKLEKISEGEFQLRHLRGR